MPGGWVLVLGIVLLGGRALDLYTVGYVASGSMEPTLPQGSLFVGMRGDPGLGDIVVFQVPSGERIVHRVVGESPEGLVTQGDANAHTDQAIGIAPPDPAQAHVVPAVAGRPIALPAAWLGAGALAVAQVAVVAFGIRTFVRPDGHAAGLQVRPHHLLLVAAALLLVTAPLHEDRVDASGTLGISSSFLPSVAHVTPSHGDPLLLHLDAFEERSLAMTGPVRVVQAPALPGAALLVHHGAAAAFMPSLLLLAGLAFALRRGGW